MPVGCPHCVLWSLVPPPPRLPLSRHVPPPLPAAPLLPQALTRRFEQLAGRTAMIAAAGALAAELAMPSSAGVFGWTASSGLAAQLAALGTFMLCCSGGDWACCFDWGLGSTSAWFYKGFRHTQGRAAPWRCHGRQAARFKRPSRAHARRTRPQRSPAPPPRPTPALLQSAWRRAARRAAPPRGGATWSPCLPR